MSSMLSFLCIWKALREVGRDEEDIHTEGWPRRCPLSCWVLELSIHHIHSLRVQEDIDFISSDWTNDPSES